MRFTIFVIITLFVRMTSNGQDKYLSKSNDCLNSPDTINGQEILYILEEMPKFNDTNFKFNDYLLKDIDFPNDNSVFYGKIVITFVIDTSGNVINGCILKSYLRDDLEYVENNILRNISTIPKWEPGKQGGKKVPVRFTFPITFGL
jgi:protein TonB